MPESVYIDTCALNRLADDDSQLRVREEADAMVRIFELVADAKLHWIASTVLRFEIDRNTDTVRRLDALKILSTASELVAPDASALQRAKDLAAVGLTYVDALHLAVAEMAKADGLLTTDDRFLNRARQHRKQPGPEPINPVDWIQRRQLWLLTHPAS
jgi:predicted nucleic acid-binding protein